MTGNFQNSNIKGFRRNQEIVKNIDKRLENGEIEARTLTIERTSAGTGKAPDDDITLEVSGNTVINGKLSIVGNVAVNGDLDISDIHVFKLVVGNDNNNSDVSFINSKYISDNSSSTDSPYSLTIDSSNPILLPRGEKLVDCSDGAMRYNTNSRIFEGYSQGNWRGLGGVRSIDGKTYVHADNSGVLDFFTKNESQMFIDVW